MFTRSALTAVLTAAAGLAASAQHADFVLFGEPNPEADQVAPERQHVHPVTAGFYHEDSFVTSDIRAWYLYHDFPKSTAISGGNVQAYAVQVRVALTDQLQFVAYKDGYANFEAGLLQDDGFLDVAAGLKWNFLQDWENDLHAAVGIGYELGVTEATIKAHITAIFRKLGVSNRTQAVIMLGKMSLVEEPPAG